VSVIYLPLVDATRFFVDFLCHSKLFLDNSKFSAPVESVTDSLQWPVRATRYELWLTASGAWRLLG